MKHGDLKMDEDYYDYDPGDYYDSEPDLKPQYSKRNSVFLEDKTKALKQSLSFFANANKRAKTIFFSQVDYWEFEIDLLIYSFQTFTERQNCWRSSEQIKQNFLKNKIPVKNSFWQDIPNQNTSNVVAPIELLNETIDLWNSLVSHCEKYLMSEKEIQRAIECGASFISNLHHMKKSHLSL